MKMAARSSTKAEAQGSLRTRQKLERQADILAAAIAVVSEKGYHGTRIADIAERAGVAYGLVYHYFGSKEKILSSILENLWQRFGRRIAKISAMENLSTAEKLMEISDYMLDTFIARPDIIRLLIQEIVRARSIENLPNLQIVRRIIQMIEGIFKEGIKNGELPADADPRLLSIAFFGSVEMLLTSLSTGVFSPVRRTDSKQIRTLKRKMRAFINGGSFGTRKPEKE